MPKEIEHKFEVINYSWKLSVEAGVKYAQAYLSVDPTVRVRVAGDKGILTVKGKSEGISRLEYEYEIPLSEAEEMMSELCETAPVEKIRYLYRHEGKVWEIDEFEGRNKGLVVAEIELESEDESFSLPSWVGECLSADYRYTNAYLAENPYTEWE